MQFDLYIKFLIAMGSLLPWGIYPLLAHSAVLPGPFGLGSLPMLTIKIEPINWELYTVHCDYFVLPTVS